MPDELITFAIIGAALLAALLVHNLIYRLLDRAASGRNLFWRALVSRTRGPSRLALIIMAVGYAASVSPLSRNGLEITRHFLLVAVIVFLAWLAKTALHIWMTVHLRRFSLESKDNLLARKHVTQSRIMQRVADTLIVIIAVGAALMTFEPVRQYGVSLLASAGAAGIVVGLALQPMLKNLFAGIQLALTQPIRIDDAVIVEGEFGNVEEITSTYVVIRLWDRRRLVVPLNYFMEQPFQNWTREESKLLGAVLIYLDYAVPLDALRAKAKEIVEASPLWDRDVFSVQVTDFRETVMEVRVLISAANSGDAFDLRCIIREELVGFLRDNYPEALPRVRAEISEEKPDARRKEAEASPGSPKLRADRPAVLDDIEPAHPRQGRGG